MKEGVSVPLKPRRSMARHNVFSGTRHEKKAKPVEAAPVTRSAALLGTASVIQKKRITGMSEELRSRAARNRFHFNQKSRELEAQLERIRRSYI